MNAPASAKLHVAQEIDGLTTSVGAAHVTERRGVVTVAFNYATEYLSLQHAYPLGPDLPLTVGPHVTTGLPGCFADSAPDRWGRNLIAKRIRALEPSPIRTIQEIEYLLGVSDLTRQGALRFSLEQDGPYLDAAQRVPKLIALPRLLAAADSVGGADDLTAVKELLDAGSGSLGGARPKASITDEGAMLIAKFPHNADNWDVMTWEKTALDLAERCGIQIAPRRLVNVGGRHVLLVERFDRNQMRRIGYISAMTLLKASDGTQTDYLEIAEAISEHGSDVTSDLSQLWRRIAFSLAINNTDDHLRNHGFLRSRAGWRLAPAFDINPDPDPQATRATSIGFQTEPEAALAALFAAAPTFGLTNPEATKTWGEILNATRGWRITAQTNGITQSECRLFEGALDYWHRT